VIVASNSAGRQMRIGLFGLTLNVNRQAYVRYADPIETAKKQVEALKNEASVIVAITHLSFDQDEALAEAVPEIALIVGGHEHQNVEARRGARMAPIVKADSNAKSVYIHRLRYDTIAKRVDIDSELKTIGPDTPEDPAVAAAATRWRDAAFAAFRAEGIEPEKTVATLPVELDGREASVRNQSTNLTQLIGQAMLDAFPGADGAIFNSGSIRIDDVLPPGPMTQYDVLRVLPFSEPLSVVRVRGSLLKQIVAVGHDEMHRNTGGYLQVIGLDPTSADRDYRVVMNRYLLDGKESGLDFIGRRGAVVAVPSSGTVSFQAAVIKRLETHGY
jgi:5'-nucleotidase